MTKTPKVLASQSDGRLLDRMYRLQVYLLVTLVVAIAAAAMSTRVLATSWSQPQRHEERLGQKVVGSNLAAGKAFHLRNLR